MNPEEWIPAAQKGEVLLQDIRSAPVSDDQFHLWWLGQSGFLLKWKNYHVLIDPYLSDSLTNKYAQTDKPHIRMSERVVDPALLDFIDIVTSSHNHTDHLDSYTLIPILNGNPGIKLIIPEANRDFVVDRLQVAKDFPMGMNDGEKLQVGDLTIFGVPAAHNRLERDEAGQCIYMGFIFHFGRHTVYHSGDTLWHGDIIQQLRAFSINVAILPINGNKPERRVAGNLNSKEAIKLGKLLGADCVIPCHYHMFTFNTADPEEFVNEAEKTGQKYCVLRPGERYCSSSV